ncbi:MAG: hypothetical protein IJC88_01835 [Oscillospiraceae bacterium]|nr:hypothetical protein [Oscillospiraceae bacterium]
MNEVDVVKEKQTAKLFGGIFLSLVLSCAIFYGITVFWSLSAAILVTFVAIVLLAWCVTVCVNKNIPQEVEETSDNQQMRKDFTANVSHELKTPLTSISGYAEMIENGMAREEDIKAFAGKIHAEAGRMISLIGDIIQLSELDEPNASLETEAVELKELAQDTVELLTFPAERRGVSLVVEGEDIVVQGSRNLLEELIYNLCDNAIRYNTPNGSVIVRTGSVKNHVWLEVQDTGIGIAPEHQSRIFERFYRVDKSRSRETGGTGLGLAIVKHIAEQHKAQIHLRSEACVGTTIRVLFPSIKRG